MGCVSGDSVRDSGAASHLVATLPCGPCRVAAGPWPSGDFALVAAAGVEPVCAGRRADRRRWRTCRRLRHLIVQLPPFLLSVFSASASRCDGIVMNFSFQHCFGGLPSARACTRSANPKTQVYTTLLTKRSRIVVVLLPRTETSWPKAVQIWSTLA